jgi:hypothetical protein
MMVTNAILGGIADTTAQTITVLRQTALRKPGGVGKDDNIAIEIHELDKKNPLLDRDLIPDSKALPPPFDFERLTRFMAYGFCMAPVQFKWFKFLSQAFPITKTSAFGPAMKRVAMDQLVFAPFGVAAFFTIMTVAEGGGRRAVYHKLRDMYVPTLKANYLVWPAVQIINFRLMPVQFQLVSTRVLGRMLPVTDRCYSPLFPPLVLPGPRTSPCPTRPRTSTCGPTTTPLRTFVSDHGMRCFPCCLELLVLSS